MPSALDKLQPTPSPGERMEQELIRNAAPLNLIQGSRAIAQVTGLSQRQVLQFIQTKELPGTWIGNKFVTDREAVTAWLRVKVLGNVLSR
jgi:pantoate kinase